VGIAIVKINIFQRFKYQKNHAISTLLVFEKLKTIDFQGGGEFENKNSHPYFLMKSHF